MTSSWWSLTARLSQSLCSHGNKSSCSLTKYESLLIEIHPEGLGATGHQYTGNTWVHSVRLGNKSRVSTCYGDKYEVLTATDSDRFVLHCVAGFKPSSSSLSSKYTQLCQQLSAFQHTVGTLYQDSACMAHWRPTSRLIFRAASRGEHQFKRGPLTLKIICVGAAADHLALDTSQTNSSPVDIYRRGCQELGFFFTFI